MDNIKFSFTSNKSGSKVKIAWTINVGEYPITKVMAREFPSEDAAQTYLDKNRDLLLQQIRGKVSKMIINANEPEEPTQATEEVIETVVEETIENVETTEEETPVEETVEKVETTEEETPVEESTEEKSEEIVEETENEEKTEQSTALVPIDERALVPVGEDEEVVVVRTTKRKVKVARRVIAGALATLILAIGISHIVKHSKKDELPGEEPGIENPSDINTPDTNNPGTEEPGEEIEEGLTTEEFENLVANLTKDFKDKNVNLTTEDITKFAAILNIDNLVAENPELASELFKDSTKEEFIQEAAKTISETVMYNAKVFEEEKSTENFVRISDALYGDSKETLVVIETYVDEIAKVYNDQEKVNALATELITRLVTGDLNDLDNGVQFGIQISIELIRSYIAKDVLSDINQDVLTDITRLNVAGIMQMYDNAKGLSGNAKTLK